MKNDQPVKILTCCFLCFLLLNLASCHNETKSLALKQSGNIKDSVQQMMNIIAKDVSARGPLAWLTHFEKTPDFFMASDGQLVFPNNNAATTFIQDKLINQIRNIDLQWSNIRIDSLTNTLAGVAANWSEKITGYNNKTISLSGYFTAVAEKASPGWQLRNAHWSAIKNAGNN